jgi:hypothetical protein
MTPLIQIEAPFAVRIMFVIALAFTVAVILEVRFFYPMRQKRAKAKALASESAATNKKLK